MNENKPVYRGTGDPLRDQNALIQQLKTDYAAVKNLWLHMQKASEDIADMDRLLQKIAWVRTDIEALRGLQKDHVEVIHWGGLDRIEREIHIIQGKIRMRMNEILMDDFSPSVKSA